MDVKIGADPEVFLATDTTFVSGHGIIPGSKEKPWPVNGGAVQVDGMALEFNINPAHSAEEFEGNINEVLLALREMVPDELDITFSATAEFNPKYMAAQPLEARQLGCDPDFNAYTGQENPAPADHPSLRTAAGHVHFGWTEDVNPFDPAHFDSCCELAIEMDYYLGIPSLLYDKNDRRRELYGKPGAFRPKPYGMEYRVLSNYWLTNSERMKTVYNSATYGFRRFVEDDYCAHKEVVRRFGMDAQEVILNKRIPYVKEIMRYLEIVR